MTVNEGKRGGEGSRPGKERGREGRKGRLRDRDQDHKAAKRGRTSFNNDAVPDSSLVSAPLPLA